MVCRVVCLKAFLGSKHPAEDKVKEILFVTKWLPFSSPIVCSIVVWKIAICDKIKVIRRENLKKGNFKNKQYYIDFRKCLISSCTCALWYDMLLHYFSNFRALYQLPDETIFDLFPLANICITGRNKYIFKNEILIRI